MTSTNTSHGSLSIGIFHMPTLAPPPVDRTTIPFDEKMPAPARHLKEQNWNSYRIYKNETEFVTIEGEAAYDAIAKSGVANPVRVVRTMKELSDVLTSEQLLDQTETLRVEQEVPKSGIIDPPAPAAPAA